MNYTTERYKGSKRFNGQYSEIYRFLLKAADSAFNEHFHWGRLEWMMVHPLLETDKLDKITMFKNEYNETVGLVCFDTLFSDGPYLIHSDNDIELLELMLRQACTDYGIEGKSATVKIDSSDGAMSSLLIKENFIKKWREEGVLEISLDRDFSYALPTGYYLSPKDFICDNYKYQLVIHKGFDHSGEPERWNDELFKPTPNLNRELKVFALSSGEYCAHCGVWYTEGDTAYIEPVVTIPQCRGLGLAKAVVYEALSRARKLGAKRAIVLSSMDFYYSLGFYSSSEFYLWENDSYKNANI